MNKKKYLLSAIGFTATSILQLSTGYCAEERSTPVTIVNDGNNPLPIVVKNQPESFPGIPYSTNINDNNIFLKIDGINGQSTDDKHMDWIEVLGFSWGVSQMASASSSTGGGTSAERADLTDLSIIKRLDASTPRLFLACANGSHISEVKVEFVDGNSADKVLYMEYTLNNVLISSVKDTSSPALGLSEKVTFNYGKIQLRYIKPKRADGSGGGTVQAGWDLEANKAF